MDRRLFLGGLAGTFAAGRRLGAQVLGANTRVRIGLIGCGGRGLFDAKHMANVPNVEFVSVCDVYEPHRLRARSELGNQCQLHADFREVLDRKDVDAVLIATPDHWHAIPTILACEAGKDVYVEKPIAHNIAEGAAMLRTARKSNRVVQTGMQQRSAEHFATMQEIVSRGEIGDVRFVRIWNYRNSLPAGIGREPNAPPPAGLDWDMFLGPAPAADYNRNRFLNFRSFREYAGGIITDWGTHRFDSMLQVLGPASPKSIAAVGGRYELQDDGNTPDFMQVTYEFPEFILSYEASAINAFGLGGRTPGRSYYRMLGKQDRPNGLAFYGSKGTLFADRLGFELHPELKPGMATHSLNDQEITADLFQAPRRDGQSADSTFLHVSNFINCVRSRERPAADIELGHRATTIAHLGNIALDTGEKLPWNAATETFDDNPRANQLLTRTARKPWDLI